jgi:hypothetical protein
MPQGTPASTQWPDPVRRSTGHGRHRRRVRAWRSGVGRRSAERSRRRRWGSSSPQKQYTGLLTRASRSSVKSIARLTPSIGVITLGIDRISLRRVEVCRSRATYQSSIVSSNLPESMAPFNPTWRSIIFALARLTGIRPVTWPRPGIPAIRMTSGVRSIGTPIDQLYNTTRRTRSGAAAAARSAKNPP